ncbi:MAG: alpha/beta hydrolase, partial [Proteobacteria bacterium]|nr:alpha/beta hydrolase [Pseudomonadota bacterium]
MEMTSDPDTEDRKSLSVAENREKLLKTSKAYSGSPVELPKITNRKIQGPAGEIPIRIYFPSENTPLPVAIFYHGGGWVQGDLETHDNLVRYLTAASGVIVVSVDYRLAPENPFPAAVDD